MPTHTLILSGSPETLPSSLIDNMICHPFLGSEYSDAAAVRQALQALPHQPSLIIGGQQTPASLWLLVTEYFPQASHWLCTENSPSGIEGTSWLKRGTPVQLFISAPKPDHHASPNSNAAMPDISATEQRAASVKVAPATPTQQAVTPTPSRPTGEPAHANGCAAWPDGKLIRETFILSAWGDTPENTRLRQTIEQAAQQRNHRQGGLLDRIHKARRNGTKARDIWLEMEKRLKQDGESLELMSWMDDTLATCHDSVRDHIRIQLEKWRTWRKSKQQSAPRKGKVRCELPPVVWCDDGSHPNSLQALKPARCWDILIDETGTTFDHQAEALSVNDAQVGRVVAIVVPQGCDLPALSNFHATDTGEDTIDPVLGTLLSKSVGIFGFSVKDSASVGIHWLSHIRQLIRWTLLQLPHDGSGPMTVRCLVEQRGTWGKTCDLGALEEILSSELVALDEERYRDLKLQIRLIGKQDDPRIGYADAVAWCWGSPSRAAKEKLRHTQWERHCLLRPDHEAMDRIYLALNRQAQLSATDWYRLCGAVNMEHAQGLLHRYLHTLGCECQQQRSRWQHYLDEVNTRMTRKQYRLSELAAALTWLDQYKPQDSNFSLNLQLQLALQQLALANHKGLIDIPQYQKVIQLADALYEEDAHTACRAILRLSTMGTNYFDFQTIQAELTRWLGEPVAVVGRLNHAKLHSAQGQLQAFRGEHDVAQHSFTRALTEFERLSDQAQAHQEKQQTSCYALINQMDHQSPEQWLEPLHNYLQQSQNKQAWVDIARSLAHSGQSRRFAHHLFLRACVLAPAELMEAWQAYLDLRSQWQQEADHPWPLINAYRAWLLQSVNETRLAQHYMQAALDQCSAPDNGVTLHWMALVLEQLAIALGLSVTQDEIDSESVHRELPLAPLDILTCFDSKAARQNRDHPAMLALLQHCLPFNFH